MKTINIFNRKKILAIRIEDVCHDADTFWHNAKRVQNFELEGSISYDFNDNHTNGYGDDSGWLLKAVFSDLICAKIFGIRICMYDEQWEDDWRLIDLEN